MSRVNSLSIDIMALNKDDLNEICFLMCTLEENIDKDLKSEINIQEILSLSLKKLNPRNREITSLLNSQVKTSIYANLSYLARNSTYFLVADLFISEALKFHKDSDLYFAKGLCQQNLLNYDEAINYYNLSIDLNKKNYSNFYHKGKILFQLKQYENAIKEFDKAIDLNENGSEFYNDKGLCLKFLDRYEEAIEEFDKAINKNNCLNKNDFFLDLKKHLLCAHYNKGYILFALKGDYDNSIKEFENAIKIDKSNFIGHYFIAMNYFMIDDFDKIEKLITKIEKIENHNNYLNILRAIKYTFKDKNFTQGSYYLNLIEDYEVKEINYEELFEERYVNKSFVKYVENSFNYYKSESKVYDLIFERIESRIKLLESDFKKGISYKKDPTKLEKLAEISPLLARIILKCIGA